MASMNMRGSWAECPENTMKVNVTSFQRKTHPDRLTFSPMTMDEYKGFPNFEAYWQSGKVFEGINHDESILWWKNIKTPRRRYPKGKNKKVLHAKFPHIDEPLDWVQSRKQVYVPEYEEKVKDTPRLQELRKLVLQGRNIAIYDFDGPRDGKNPTVKKLTVDLLKTDINQTIRPFGHGYVVAALLAGITSEQYVS